MVFAFSSMPCVTFSSAVPRPRHLPLPIALNFHVWAHAALELPGLVLRLEKVVVLLPVGRADEVVVKLVVELSRVEWELVRICAHGDSDQADVGKRDGWQMAMRGGLGGGMLGGIECGCQPLLETFMSSQ